MTCPWPHGITNRGEEILSYLCGLSPVGEEFFLVREWAIEDLEISGVTLSHIIRQLIYWRALKRTARGQYIVLQRPEQCVKSNYRHPGRRRAPRLIAWNGELVTIPESNRNFNELQQVA